MGLEIRRAFPSDAGIIAPLNLRLIRDEGHRNPMGVAALRNRMKRWLRAEHRAVLIEADGRVVGYFLYRREPEYWYVRHFFIDRTYRRLGLGRTAFRKIRRVYWKRPIRIRIEALALNRRGIQFWKALGFAPYALTMERCS